MIINNDNPHVDMDKLKEVFVEWFNEWYNVHFNWSNHEMKIENVKIELQDSDVFDWSTNADTWKTKEIIKNNLILFKSPSYDNPEDEGIWDLYTPALWFLPFIGCDYWSHVGNGSGYWVRHKDCDDKCEFENAFDVINDYINMDPEDRKLYMRLKTVGSVKCNGK